ncbi:MAG TPA: MFS transporter [Steroidobacteraceae bacterium]|jgi:predicted MFS family arabinose efflux permease|nr:MFS transporter [Steroidobacteraceae bacterium]
MTSSIEPIADLHARYETKSIVAVVVLAALMAATLMAAPGIVDALVGTWGYSHAQAGYAIGIEQFCMSIAAIPAVWWTQCAARTPIVRWCLVAVVAGNLLCIAYHDVAALLVLRMMTGLAAGSVMAACLAVIGSSGNPERNFALWAVGQLTLGAAMLALIPMASIGARATVIFIGLAVGVAASLPIADWLGRPPRNVQGRQTAAPKLTLGAAAGLLAVLAFYVAIGGVWTYIGTVGAVNGVPPVLIAHDLSIASLFGIGGCVVAALIGGRLGRAIPMCIGYLLLLAVIVALQFPSGKYGFAISTFGFLFAWLLSLPYLLASVAAHDATGRLSVLTNLMIGTGLGLGPVFFAQALRGSHDFRAGILGAGAAMAVSCVLAVMTLRLPTPAIPTSTAQRSAN